MEMAFCIGFKRPSPNDIICVKEVQVYLMKQFVANNILGIVITVVGFILLIRNVSQGSHMNWIILSAYIAIFHPVFWIVQQGIFGKTVVQSWTIYAFLSGFCAILAIETILMRSFGMLTTPLTFVFAYLARKKYMETHHVEM